MRRKKTKEYFTVLSTPRSGSNYLSCLLSSHEDVKVFGELFHPDGIFYEVSSGEKGGLKDIDFRAKHPLSFLYSVLDKGNEKIVGYKLFPEHSPRILLHCLMNRRMKVIYLYREDVVKAYISLIKAQKTGKWLQTADQPSSDAPSPIHFRKYKFQRYIRKKVFLDLFTKLLFPRKRLLVLKYQDIIEKDVSPILAEFLKTSSTFSKTGIALRKQSTSKKPSEIVSNYEEMASFIRKNYPKYAKFLS